VKVSRTVIRIALAATTLAAAGALNGCEDPLLAPTDERSPFDRYDTVRNQYAEQRKMDEFGHPRANLRERLLPKD
jgi:hypothetical protein